MEIRIIKDAISKKELKQMAKKQFGDLVKAVVDVEKEIMAIGGELHSDEEVFLMEQASSKRENTWGINLYPKATGEKWIEFDSVVNLKPAFGNRSRSIDNLETKKKVKDIVEKLTSPCLDG